MRKKKKKRGKHYVYETKKYYSVFELHEEVQLAVGGLGKGKAIQSNLMVRSQNFGISQTWVNSN